LLLQYSCKNSIPCS